jgi:hypothetical protein
MREVDGHAPAHESRSPAPALAGERKRSITRLATDVYQHPLSQQRRSSGPPRGSNEQDRPPFDPQRNAAICSICGNIGAGHVACAASSADGTITLVATDVALVCTGARISVAA